MNQTPCCGHAAIRVVDGDEGYIVGYRCSQCGDEYEACATEMASGEYCPRLADECRYH